MKSIRRALPPTATRSSSSLNCKQTKCQAPDIQLGAHLASASLSAPIRWSYFPPPFRRGRAINPSTGEARRARGKSTAAANIHGRQTLSSHFLTFSLLSAKSASRTSHPICPLLSPDPVIALAPAELTVARCRLCTECGKADQRRARRRRPPHRRATIRSSK